MDHLTDQELIDKHLRGELSDEERHWLEERRSSPEFTVLLRHTEGVVEAVAETGREELKNEMSMWYTKNYKSNSTKPQYIRWSAIAASFLILVSVLTWLFYPDRYERLSGSYADPFPDFISQVTRGEEPRDATYIRLMTPYHDKDWQAALSGYDEYLNKNPDDFKIRLYMGIALYQNEQYEKAASTLQDVLEQTNDHTFAQPARWYLILALVAGGQKADAVQMLRDLLSDPQHYQFNKAKELLKKLES